MNGFRERWNQNHLASLDEAHTLNVTQNTMERIPGLDAKTAQIIGTAPNAEHMIRLIEQACREKLVSLRFVETWAKGPGRNWERLIGYWEGVLASEEREILVEAICDSLGEAMYAEELERLGAETDLQYTAGRNYIDIRVGISTRIPLSIADALNGEILKTTVEFGPSSTLAVEFKNYGQPSSFSRNAKKIAAEVHAGKILGESIVATVQDFWEFDQGGKAASHRVVTEAGSRLSVSSFRKSDLRREASRILDEGRRKHDR